MSTKAPKDKWPKSDAVAVGFAAATLFHTFRFTAALSNCAKLLVMRDVTTKIILYCRNLPFRTKVLLLLLVIVLGAATWKEISHIRRDRLLAFYLVTDGLPCDSLVGELALPEKVILAHRPFISGSDILEWDVTNHTFIITLNAEKRVEDTWHAYYAGMNRWATEQTKRTNVCTVGVPFALTVRGEIIYIGVISSDASSAVCVVPTMLAWPAAFIDPKIEGVGYKIRRGYPSDEYGRGPDLRNNKEIVAAVGELFAGRQQPPPSNK